MALNDANDRIQNASSIFNGVRQWNARTLPGCRAASGFEFHIDYRPTPPQLHAMCANSDCIVLVNEVLTGMFRLPQYGEMPELTRALSEFAYEMIPYCTMHHIQDEPCAPDPLEQLLVDLEPIVAVCETRAGISIRRAVAHGTLEPPLSVDAMCDVPECDNVMRRLFMKLHLPICTEGFDKKAVQDPLMDAYMRVCDTANRRSWAKPVSMPLPLLYTFLPGPVPLGNLSLSDNNATIELPLPGDPLTPPPSSVPLPLPLLEATPAVPTAKPTDAPTTSTPVTLPVPPPATLPAPRATTAMATTVRPALPSSPSPSVASRPPSASSGAGLTIPPTNTNRPQRSPRPPPPPPSLTAVDETDAVVPTLSTQRSMEPTLLRFSLIAVSTVLVLLIVWLVVRRRRHGVRSKDATTEDDASAYHTLDDTTSDPASVSDDATISHGLLVACTEIAVNRLHDVRIIGSGGFGVGVYLVRDTQSKRLLASKRLGRSQRNADQLDAFIREISLAATLSHPRIVTFVGIAGLHKTGLQALFEYVAGGDLKRYLDCQSPIDPTSHSWTPEKLQIAIDIADALAYLQTLQPTPVVHRDLKSRNIMLTSESRAKLGDFGVSRTESAAGSMTTGVGTSRWVAPEVILGGGDYTTACDVYSFGVVLSELDTHRLPFSDLVHANGEQLADFVVLPMVVTERKQPSFSDACPPSILALAQNCLAFEPADRPTAGTIAEALRMAQRGFGWEPNTLEG